MPVSISNPRVQQFLDLRHDLGRLAVILRFVRLVRITGLQDRPAGGVMVHDGRQDGRLQEGPVAALGPGHRQEVRAEIDPGHLVYLEQRRRQGRQGGVLGRGHFTAAGSQHLASWQELEDLGVRGGFGLDKHDDR